MQDKKVLLVDDDSYMLELTRRVFQRAGSKIISASDGQEGLRLFFEHQPDLVILDIVMPNLDGWETCRQIRTVSDTPVVLLTSLSSDEEIVRGLEAGADDFVSKPFRPEVLLARARAVMRRVRTLSNQELVSSYADDHLSIDLESRLVFIKGKRVSLTPTEYRLLVYMVRNEGRVLSFSQILEHVWGEEYRDSPNYVHVYISHLRQKLEPEPQSPRYFLSEHGMGYRFASQNN
jgi:two-component system KDP operon response regulator KdpE